MTLHFCKLRKRFLALFHKMSNLFSKNWVGWNITIWIARTLVGQSWMVFQKINISHGIPLSIRVVFEPYSYASCIFSINRWNCMASRFGLIQLDHDEHSPNPTVITWNAITSHLIAYTACLRNISFKGLTILQKIF